MEALERRREQSSRELAERVGAFEEEQRARAAGMRERIAALEQREHAVADLESRAAKVEQHEVALRTATQELDARAAGLERMETQLHEEQAAVARQASELEAAERSREEAVADVARRTAELDSRQSAIAEREAELDRAWETLEQAAMARIEAEIKRENEELAAREAALAEREADLHRREHGAEPPPSRVRPKPTAAPSVPEVESAGEEPGLPAPPQAREIPAAAEWGLDALARLVEEHADAHPDRLDEWRATIVYLREFADQSGTLPDSFDGLVADVFGPIIDESDAPLR